MIKKVFQSRAISALKKWSKCVRTDLLLICVITVVLTLFSLGVTIATKGLIDGAVGSKPDKLISNGIALALLILAERGGSAGLGILRTRASSKLQHSLQTMLIEEVFNKDYAKIRHFHSGELVNRFFSDVSVVKNGIINILPSFVRMGVSFFGAAAILVAMDWRFVFLLIVGGLLGLGLVLLFRKPMKQRHKRMQEAEGKLHASAQESMENIRLIKASVSEDRTMKRVGEYQDHLRDEQIRQGNFSIAMNNSIGLTFDLSWLFCMLWGCVHIYHGVMTYGSLAAMIQLIGRIQGPIANAVNLAGQAYGVIASAERLQELTELPEDAFSEPISRFDEIRLEDVVFRYDDSIDSVLNGVSCTIRRGDFVALTGLSGGGKSSLFQLLLGIYRPTSGRVVFVSDGREVQASAGSRGLFAYVPQGNTLFSGTLRENLVMFTDSVTDEEIMAAVKAACIDELVEDIGLKAALGERGVGLSEGQAQRVAIARALLSKAPILLLDEATSALDEQTEAKLIENISAMRDRTCIIVTHRRAALKICDYQLNISDGRLKEEKADVI